MGNITTSNLKTIVQSVLASARRYKPNLSVTDPDDPRYVAGAEGLVNKVSKAQTTAASAKSTAESAKSTAASALTTAESAKSTAASAKSTAASAESTAASALTTASAALPKGGGIMTGNLWFGGGIGNLDTSGQISGSSIQLQATKNTAFGTIILLPQENAETCCYVGRDSNANTDAPSTLWFLPNGGDKMILKGMNTLKMRSDNTTYWNLEIDGDGQLVVTDSSDREVRQTVSDLTLTSPGGTKFRVTVDDTGTLTATEVTEDA